MRRWRGLLATGVCLVTLAGVFWLTWRLWLGGEQGAAKANVLALPVAIVGTVLAGIGLVVGLVARPSATRVSALMETALTLLDRVVATETNTLNRLLGDEGDPRPADVGFARSVLLRWRADGSGDEGSLNTIAAYYDDLDRGRLVILGEAGAGKTVLSLRLLLDLAQSRSAAVTVPGAPARLSVPVRLNLASFTEEIEDLTAQTVRERLDRWIARQLTDRYGIRAEAATALVSRRWITPILDGMDEMDKTGDRSVRAKALLAALNVPTGSAGWPVVLASRSETYTLLATPTGGRALQDATVVVLQPLTTDQIVSWLAHRFPDPAQPPGVQQHWQPVVRTVSHHPRGRLATCLANPLYLYLAVTAYQDPAVSTKELCGLSTAKLAKHLFTRLIPAITQHHPLPDGTRWDSGGGAPMARHPGRPLGAHARAQCLRNRPVPS
jgi:hypothetical protein